MNAIILLVNIVFIIIGLISIIVYYSNKRMLKKSEAVIREELIPFRIVSESEISAVSKFYNKKITPDTPVYRIKGSLDKISLTVNHNTNSEYWIGGIQIFARIGLAENCFFEEDYNLCEFIYLENKNIRAYPLMINGCFIHQSFHGNTASTETAVASTDNSSDPFSKCSYRDASAFEQRFIGGKFRWLAYLFLLPLMALFSPDLFVNMNMTAGTMTLVFPLLYAGGVFSVLSFFFLFKKSAYKTGRKEIHCLNGILEASEKQKRNLTIYTLKGTTYKFSIPRKYAKSINLQGAGPYPIDVYIKQKNTSDILGTVLKADTFSIESFFRKKWIFFYRPFIAQALLLVLLGLFYLNFAGSGTPFFNGGSLSKVIDYYRSGPKLVTQEKDLALLEEGDVVIFDKLLAINKSDRWTVAPVEKSLFKTLDSQGRTDEFAINMTDYWKHLNSGFELYLRYDTNEKVSIYDKSFFTDPQRPIHCIDNRKMNHTLYVLMRFDPKSNAGKSLRAAFKRSDSAENIHPLLLDLVEELKMMMMKKSSKDIADHYNWKIINSITEGSGFKKLMKFDLFNDEVVLDDYIDSRWASNDIDVLKPLVFESAKGLALCGYLNGTFYMGKIKIAGQTDYYNYDYDSYSFGHYNIFKRIVISYLAPLGFISGGVVMLLVLLIFKFHDFSRSRPVSLREKSPYSSAHDE